MIDRLTMIPVHLGLTGINTDDPIYAEYGEYITLLYAVTVIGEEGASYTVTDPTAVCIDPESESGVIPASGDAVIFYTKSFKIPDDIVDINEIVDENGTYVEGYLDNIAYVKAGPNTNPIYGTDPGEATPSETTLQQVFARKNSDLKVNNMTSVNMNNNSKINALEQIDGNITPGIVKELIEYELELPDDIKEKLEASGDLIYYPEDQGYVSANEGSVINLAYKVTVKGDKGANYAVTDSEAKWIGGNPETGIIPENGEAIIYYIKSFEITEDTKVLENVATVTSNTNLVQKKVLVQKNLEVKKIWEDNENAALKRPESVILQLKDGENIIEEVEVSEKNNWSYEFEVPKYDELGNEIEYTVDEKETNKFYEKIIDGYTVINRYKNIENTYDNIQNNVDTSDINVAVYVIIFFVAVIGIICIIYFIRKNKVNK